MNEAPQNLNRRILVVDDSPQIHADFKKILCGVKPETDKLADLRAAFSGGAPDSGAPAGGSGPLPIAFELDSAFQGPQALEMLIAAADAGRPYALAFVDVRMPPGWDGIETVEHLWRADDKLQVVICTAYSDHTWESTFRRLGQSDRLLILKKPFDPVEIQQLAAALTEKWNAERTVGDLIADLRAKEQEARAYSSSLETVNRALSTSKAAAEKASAMKTEFLLQLSTQISSQVEEVLGALGRLGDDPACQEVAAERLESVFHCGRYLLATVDEISDIARIEAGELDLVEEDFAPIRPIEEVVEELRRTAGKKGLDVRVGMRGELPPLVRTDYRRVRQIVWNLVDNAIRFTDEGTVTVTVTAEQNDRWETAALRYTVEDTGPGIPKARLGRVFEPFDAECDPDPDAGCRLGLAHSQRIARLLGGDLQARSEEGRGSRFELTVEVECRAGTSAPVSNGAAAHAPGPQRRVS